jgi:hypothetical protein
MPPRMEIQPVLTDKQKDPKQKKGEERESNPP